MGQACWRSLGEQAGGAQLAERPGEVARDCTTPPARKGELESNTEAAINHLTSSGLKRSTPRADEALQGLGEFAGHALVQVPTALVFDQDACVQQRRETFL